MSEWFFIKGGQQQGPVTPEKLKELVTTGQLCQDDLVWQDGLANWVQAGSVKGLFAAPAPSVQQSSESSNQPGTVQEASARSATGQLMRSIATQLLARIPPGKVQFTFIDPVGLGDTFAQFMDLKKYDDDLVTHRVWTEPRQIEQQLPPADFITIEGPSGGDCGNME